MACNAYIRKLRSTGCTRMHMCISVSRLTLHPLTSVLASTHFPYREAQSGSPSHIHGKGEELFCLCMQCICSCPVAYANGPSGAPAPAPMMDPSIITEDMAGAMDSGADADSSSSGSGCAPKPVPTQYEAFENVRFLMTRA